LTGIALTGYGMDEDVNRCHAAGFAAHLTKPVSIEALDSVLAAAVRR
jgi:CheY-like chemotaxis protein